MGNQITWNAQPSDSDWEKTAIYRSSSENGDYTLIKSQDLPDTSYYDCDGETGSWYKIKFTTTIGNCSESDFSEAIQGISRIIYADPIGVLQTAGLTTETLPDSITINTIYNWIYDISRNIDEMNNTVYGRIEAFPEHISGSRHLDNGKTLKLPYRPVSDLVIEYRQSITEDTWITLNEFFDYEVIPEKGRIYLYRFPLILYRNVRDIKVNGNYGQLTIPNNIRQLVEILASIKIFVHITGGTYNDVTSYSLGPYNESLGEPYINLRETIKILENDKKRLMQETGISDKKINLRFG